jgi:aminoglycoside 3-N-acetyltransferase I
MEIKKLEGNAISEFRELVEIFKDVFEREDQIPVNEHLSALLSNPDFIVFVALNDGKIVGGLTIYVLHSYYSPKPSAYIYDVGITPAFQRRGFGKALIAEVCKYCKQNNFNDLYVEAESEDFDAINFYSNTKFSNQLHAVHYTYVLSDETII